METYRAEVLSPWMGRTLGKPRSYRHPAMLGHEYNAPTEAKFHACAAPSLLGFRYVAGRSATRGNASNPPSRPPTLLASWSKPKPVQTGTTSFRSSSMQNGYNTSFRGEERELTPARANTRRCRRSSRFGLELSQPLVFPFIAGTMASSARAIYSPSCVRHWLKANSRQPWNHTSIEYYL